MKTARQFSTTFTTLVLGLLAAGSAAVHAAPGGMQVEEPALSGPKPPIQPELDQAAWQDRDGGLTAEQKAALKARQQTMKDMMALIQKKRLAIRDARPEDRQALALELQDLILEKSQTERGRGRSGDRKDSSRDGVHPSAGGADLDVNVRVREARQKSADQKVRQLELKEELLRQQEARRQALEEKLKLLEEKLKKKDEDD